MTSDREANEVLVADDSLASQLAVAGFEGICQPLDLCHHQDEVIQSQPPASRVVLSQNVLDNTRG